jgi:protein ImuB
MYACLHCDDPSIAPDELLELAAQFSPAVEQTDAKTVVFSIDGLRKLIGSPHQIASEISRYGHARKLKANLAIAANPDTAILLAQHRGGITLVNPGEEFFQLAAIPITSLFGNLQYAAEIEPVLSRWGLKTCEDLAALPEKGIAERLGKAGVHLRNLACGRISRPLRIPQEVTSYEERLVLEHPLSLLEPLLFLFASVLNVLCQRLRSQSRAARSLQCKLELEGAEECLCPLQFPVPLDNSQSILKLLQLYLEAHPPGAPVVAFTLSIEAVEPRRLQGGFFLPTTPTPDKLQITLARIRGMVGEENAGTPALLNTHRPDAFSIGELNPVQKQTQPAPQTDFQSETLHLAMRLFRPALHARVTVADKKPRHVSAHGVQGRVVEWAGPWKTSGEWWAATAWSREEWDVELEDGSLYRIYMQQLNSEWYIHAIYD